jgi:hypothetical protein
MRRLTFFVAVEEETIRADPVYCRHMPPWRRLTHPWLLLLGPGRLVFHFYQACEQECPNIRMVSSSKGILLVVRELGWKGLWGIASLRSQ